MSDAGKLYRLTLWNEPLVAVVSRDTKGVADFGWTVAALLLEEVVIDPDQPAEWSVGQQIMVNEDELKELSEEEVVEFAKLAEVIPAAISGEGSWEI